MEKIKFKVKGLAPLMLHNERLANPMDPVTRELKKLTAVRKKTDETLAEIMKTEWLGGLYLNEEGNVAVPSDNVLASIKAGARKSKRGKDVESSLFAEEAFYAVDHDGPSTPEEMWAAGKYCDYRGVGVNGKRIMRSRPIIRRWGLKVELTYDSEIIDVGDLQEWITVAGNQIGLCERRPKFGRFTAEF
jgi:hypothetical protein